MNSDTTHTPQSYMYGGTNSNSDYTGTADGADANDEETYAEFEDSADIPSDTSSYNTFFPPMSADSMFGDFSMGDMFCDFFMGDILGDWTDWFSDDDSTGDMFSDFFSMFSSFMPPININIVNNYNINYQPSVTDPGNNNGYGYQDPYAPYNGYGYQDPYAPYNGYGYQDPYAPYNGYGYGNGYLDPNNPYGTYTGSPQIPYVYTPPSHIYGPRPLYGRGSLLFGGMLSHIPSILNSPNNYNRWPGVAYY